MSPIKLLLFSTVLATGPPDVPELPERPAVQLQGTGTYYGEEGTGMHGDRMANGERFEPHERATLATKPPPEGPPLGTLVLVEVPETGRSKWMRRTDAGPWVVDGPDGIKPVTPQYEPTDGEEWVRVADLSIKAAKQLGVYKGGEGGMFEVRLRWYDREHSDPMVWREE